MGGGPTVGGRVAAAEGGAQRAAQPAHAMPADDALRLVVDIGGGSTECIIGRNYESEMLESVAAGCVSLSERFFPNGQVTQETFEHACYSARAAFAPLARAYRGRGWSYAVGTSGTAKALCQVAEANFGGDRLTRNGSRPGSA